MNIGIAQINPIVGNIEKNKEKILSYLDKTDLVVFPELALTGYPPKDLLVKNKFIETNLKALNEIASHCKKYAIIGFVDKIEDKLYNAAALIHDGKIIHIEHKKSLPNYDVFDEKRYFTPGEKSNIVEIFGKKIGINICEDIWIDKVCQDQCNQGAELIINISASPFNHGKYKLRETILSEKAKKHNVPVVYVNLVGGQDDLVFDGKSYVFSKEGKIVFQANSFEESFKIINDFEKEIEFNKDFEEEEIKKALVLGLKDYVHKNGFSKVVLGLSGGIDSALTCALAVEALGKENVIGISMPSKFSSSGSVDDSEKLANNLGIEFDVISIKNIFDSYIESLNKQFQNTQFNVAEENIQARIRGNLLMALSNKFGYLVLATGNKSETSVGYATLYGDMSGGLSVISDVFKTKVYAICKHINKEKEIIPNEIITKEPSAELREDQKDSDSLPEYNILDPILKSYIENDKGFDEIVYNGYDKEIVRKIINLVDRNEYKRQQAATGIRITHRAFGTGRRMPITNGWKE